MKRSTSEHFPRDQELWVEVNSLGCLGRRWLRSSAGSPSTCFGKVRSGFYFVFLYKKKSKTKPNQVRPPNPVELAVVSFPHSPSQRLLQEGLQTLVSQPSGY